MLKNEVSLESENMALNFSGAGGELRYLSMDGKIGQKDVEGLERAHHDFAVIPGGRIATMPKVQEAGS